MNPMNGSVRRSAVHFGLNVRAGSKPGLRVDRDTYATINKRSSTYFPRERASELWDSLSDAYDDEDHRFMTDECVRRTKPAHLKIST